MYDNSDGNFRVSLLLGSARRWRAAKKRLLAAGFALGQNGETEGTLLFVPESSQQAKAAIREAGIRIRKPASPKQLAALARAREDSARIENRRTNGPFKPKKPTRTVLDDAGGQENDSGMLGGDKVGFYPGGKLQGKCYATQRGGKT